MSESNATPRPIPAAFRDLIEQPNHASLATTLPNGTPQVTIVWFNTDEEGYVYVNTAVGRLKDKAIRQNPYVALAVLDPNNPYRYIQLRGPVVEVIEGQEARAHIDALSARYTGNPVYSFGPPDEQRVKFKVAPEHIQTMG
jgi:PPOX class probable F420-dependent enzyme